MREGEGANTSGPFASGGAPGAPRRLGRTDLYVTPVGVGCWQFSGGRGAVGRFWPALDAATTRAIVEAALAGGVSWFDSAEAYGGGESERALARALSEVGCAPGDAVVATKWWPALRTARHLENRIDERIRALEPFPIDLYQIHQPLSLSRPEREMRAMAALCRAGKIRAAGVSNFSAVRMRRAAAGLASEGFSLASNQVSYSLLDRRIETNGVMEAAAELGISIIAYSPLAQGILSGKFHDDPSLIRTRPGPRRFLPSFWRRGLEKSRPVVQALGEIAEQHGATSSQVAIAWVTQFYGDRVVAIPGATKPEHAREAASAMQLRLSSEELSRLDQLSRAFR